PDEAVFTEEEVEEKATQVEAAAEEVVEEKVTQPVEKSVQELLHVETAEESEPKPEPESDQEEAAEEIPAWAKSSLKPIKPITPIGPSKLDQFLEKVGGLIAKATAIWNEYQAYPNKREIMLALKKFLGRLLHSLRLRGSVVHLRLGLADPSTLGTITGVVAVIGSWCQNRGLHLEFQPEFQEECVEVSGQVEMHIRILALSWIALRLVLNKYILRLIMYIVKRPKK
ncbi:MAG: hypothetical protein IJ315_10375, partial [Firmicutes bacterium]|nr:hypothetical protein [Bacillota bacterium]